MDIPLGPLFTLNNSTDISTTSDEITDRYFSDNLIYLKKQLLTQLDSSLMKFTIFSSADQKPLKESEKQPSPPAVGDSASINISYFHTVETVD